MGQVERPGQDREQQVGIRERRRFNQVNAIGECARDLVCHFQRDARLADPSGPRDREQPGFILDQRCRQRAYFGVTADQGSEGSWKRTL